MARMKRNIGEMVSGKIGNVVFVTINDKSYVRSAPMRKKDSWTGLQQLYRQRISSIAALWRSIPYGALRSSWSAVSPELNGYASFVKANMGALAIDGSLIDPTRLTLTQGKGEIPQLLKAQREAPLSPVIGVSWQNDPNSPPERLKDALWAIPFDGNHFSAPMDTGLKRADLSGTFILPPIPPGRKVPTTLFLFLITTDGVVSRSKGFELE